jgi:hypothetical protein
MANISPVFPKCHLSTRLVDVVKLSIKLTIDPPYGHCVCRSVMLKVVSVFCKNMCDVDGF